MRWLRSVCYQAAKGKMVRIARERAPRFEKSAAGILPIIQLQKLNQVWEDACRNVPYYARLKKQHDLPDRFSCQVEFSSKVPILYKRDLQENRELFRRAEGGPDGWVKTGGSTGEPLSVGIWRNEGIVTGANQIIGRSWYGVEPGDKLFLVWGHAHMLGSGWRYVAKSFQRRLKDKFLGYCRMNAYFLDSNSLSRMAEVYLRSRPDYVIGYSGALALLAKHVAGKADFKPKVVIGCAEGFPDLATRQQVAEAFHAPVAMEYGSVECGCMAHEHPRGGYHVFWDTHLVEAEGTSSPDASLLVSKLTRCYTPLLRYWVGDRARIEERTDGPLEDFAQVSGRANDFIVLPGGHIIHSAVLDHAIRGVSGVLQFQLVGQSGRPRMLRVRTEGEWDPAIGSTLRERLTRVNREFFGLTIVPVEDLPKTAAGKVRWFVDESGPLQHIMSVEGRTDDITVLPNGTKIHWAVIDDALCTLPSVLQFQLVRRNGEPKEIRLRLDCDLSPELEETIRNRLGRVDTDLASLSLVQVDDMPKTPAGKVRWYVDE